MYVCVCAWVGVVKGGGGNMVMKSALTFTAVKTLIANAPASFGLS